MSASSKAVSEKSTSSEDGSDHSTPQPSGHDPSSNMLDDRVGDDFPYMELPSKHRRTSHALEPCSHSWSCTQKLQDMLQELPLWLAKCSTTKWELLSLTGKLSFAIRAVPVGRLLLQCLIHLSTSAIKLHHHIRLTTDVWAHWWYSWNGTAKFLHPHLLLQKTWSFVPMLLAQVWGIL